MSCPISSGEIATNGNLFMGGANAHTMHTSEPDAEIKAYLLSIGRCRIERGLVGGETTVPTAGPGAGGESFFITWRGHRVRLSIADDAPLEAVPKGDEMAIIHEGKEIVRGKLDRIFSHCPKQAYITITESCIMDCKFCPVPKLGGKRKSLEEITAIIEEGLKHGSLSAIALTSGIAHSKEEEVKLTCNIVRELKRRYRVPIGVSVYPVRGTSRRLKEAGADEVKYNVETMDRELFSRLCVGCDLDEVLEELKEAVKVFGRNRVFSNFIIGLGESDETVLKGVEELAHMGVIPILRPYSPHPLRKGEIEAERPSKERLLHLARELKKILERYGLDTRVARTMCLPCGGCDLVPMWDV